MKQKYYRILEVKPGAGKEEIKSAYRRKAKQWHPDLNPSPDAHDRFVEIHEAYLILLESPETSPAPPPPKSKVAPARPKPVHDDERERERRARQEAQRYARMHWDRYRKEAEEVQKNKEDYLLVQIVLVIVGIVFITIPFFEGMKHPAAFLILWLLALATFYVAYELRRYVNSRR